MLNQLQLPRLQKGRPQARVIMMYSIVHDLVEIQVALFIQTKPYSYDSSSLRKNYGIP